MRAFFRIINAVFWIGTVFAIGDRAGTFQHLDTADGIARMISLMLFPGLAALAIDNKLRFRTSQYGVEASSGSFKAKSAQAVCQQRSETQRANPPE
jgi:hypothetical protein